MKKFFAEFKKFITRGNVLDMAVGVIVGGAFTAIVTSLNKDLITPLLGLIGGTDFSDLKITMVEGVKDAAGEWTKAPVELMYGNFITAVLNFLITAFAIFCLVKAINKIMDGRKKKEEKPAAPTEKDCPFCKTKIHIDATRCPHCTSELK